MIPTATITETEALIPQSIAEQVLTAGPDHINYRGGVGSVMNVYARHFAEYKCVTSHKPTTTKWALIPFFISQYVRFVQTLRSDRAIRIVHLQGSFKGSFYRKLALFLTAKYGFGKKIVYHMHGSKFDVFYHNSDPISKRLIRLLVEGADTVVCLSDYWYTFFSENFRTQRLEILGNVIHQREPELETPFIRTENGPLQLLFLGAIGERKGIFDLLDALRQHRQFFTGRLVLRVGGNGETERLQSYIRDNQLEELVQFEGWVSGEKKHELLSTSDVYILPSYHEGLPISILEAMNYQLPILSTPVGGTAEAVHEGVNGFLVSPGDKEAMADRLMRFVSQPELASTMGLASSRIVRQYLPETIFPQLRNLYESLLQEPAA
ncbi:glycosyltransferase family 4 protein [Spirosoma sp. KNUC1025]|uniref:glycosyltransferase family 4 protein n=1 Tax=Spirosoma sp. KNUC1025 TaxID=2894082 RepID=UPI003867F2E5|nr:glycosyltransferase family 4 protein [Spirosoma sp. KNUC1025]